MENDQKDLRSIFVEALNRRLAQASPADKERMSHRLSEMRSYAVGRHDYYDRLRTQLVAVSAALLPLTVAVATFFYTATKSAQIVPLRMKVGAAAACIGLAVAGCYVILMFAVGFSPRFAYRKVARILSWYYAYTPTHAFIDEFFLPDSEAEQARRKFAEGLRDYGESWFALAKDIDSTIIEDIEQTFILFGLQKHRRDEAASFAQFLAVGIGVAAIGGSIMVSAIIWP
jgi:hypothetical protein